MRKPRKRQIKRAFHKWKLKWLSRQREVDISETEKEYEVEVITRGNCMMCGKELTEGLFFCKECEEKTNSRK